MASCCFKFFLLSKVYLNSFNNGMRATFMFCFRSCFPFTHHIFTKYKYNKTINIHVVKKKIEQQSNQLY